jgi:hypothetical protein
VQALSQALLFVWIFDEKSRDTMFEFVDKMFEFVEKYGMPNIAAWIREKVRAMLAAFAAHMLLVSHKVRIWHAPPWVLAPGLLAWGASAARHNAAARSHRPKPRHTRCAEQPRMIDAGY